MSIKIVYVTLRKAGLDYRRSGFYELAAMMLTDNEVVDEINLQLRPMTGKILNTYHIEKHGFSLSQIDEFMPSAEAHRKFVEFLEKHIDRFNPEDKAFFAGYESFFDKGLMIHWFRDHDDSINDFFYSGSIDIKSLALNSLMYERKQLDAFGVGDVASYLDIEGDRESPAGINNLTRKIHKELCA
jgi:hypothetical protein